MPRTPIWSSIAANLTAEIAAGTYAQGIKLPTEAQLALRFGVNRHTVRRALGALAEAGLVQPRRGAGVFVTSVPTEYPLGRRVRFTQNVLASGRTPSRRLLRSEIRPASADEAEALALPPSALVHLIEGVSLADGVPIGLFRSVLPALRFPDFAQDMARFGSITAALAHAGVADYTRALTRLTAKSAPPTCWARPSTARPAPPFCSPPARDWRVTPWRRLSACWASFPRPRSPARLGRIMAR
jgi:GntR family phosphonate transport system transcriptional regulator